MGRKDVTILCIIYIIGMLNYAASFSSNNLNAHNDMKREGYKHIFYILRHGQTDANASGRIQGSTDFSRLTDLGRSQAQTLGVELTSDFCISNQVYVSPLSRARETLAIVKSIMNGSEDTMPRLSYKEFILEDLREIDLYAWEGKHKNDIKAENPESYAAWKTGDPHGFSVRDISNNDYLERYPLLELWERAESVWNEIHEMEENYRNDMAKHGSKKGERPSSLIVCHGSLGQALLGSAIGKDANFFREAKFPNCGMVEIEWMLKAGDIGKASRWRWFQPQESEWWEP